LSELLDRYHRDQDQIRTEADVSANFVDQLFAALGWDIFSALEYNRQRYIREAGYADIGLLIGGDPRLFVEVKRFGLIPKSSERRGDRTPEEKQAFKYARQEKIRWAVLTNFERLHVFDADQERLILAFDDPQEYVQRIEELNRLARANIEHKSLEHFASLQAKEDIDRHFLENLMRWRKLLAQDILDRNANNDAILTAGKPDLDKLRRVVQRILDRLVIIRFADDRELLDGFGVVEAMLGGFKASRSYAAEGRLYRDFLDFCAGMDRKHNTEIFSPKHPCEQVTVGNNCLEQIFDEIAAISFRKYTSDILGNTYESYLGHRLELKDGHIELAERRDLRKGAGIYYTPPHIVRYIVDHTLGKKLEELEVRHGLAAAHEARNLKVLDPACGSGSFLIYAFDVLAAFYERCNQRITAEKVHLLQDHEFGDVLGTQGKIKTLPSLLFHYRIEWDGSYLRYVPSELYNPKSKELLESPKILVKRVAVRLTAIPDDGKPQGFFYPLNTIYALVPKPECRYSLLFLTALLNSSLLDFAYKQQFGAISVRGGYVEFREYLKYLHLPKLDLEQKAAKTAHDKLADFAKQMLRFNCEKIEAEQAFAGALNNHPHDWKGLGDTYWNRPEYVALVEKKTHVKASDTAEITGLRCELDGQTIQVSAKAGADWNPVLDMAVADDKLRFFIFYGIRQFLHDNARKKKWGEGKLLQTVLEKIQVPVFFSHGVYDHETHLKTLKLILAEMKKKSPLLNLTELERDIAATDNEIDDRVFALYGLTDKEIKLVKES
jgi:hypothetical protein